MGKQASTQGSSTFQLANRLFVLMLLVSATAIGCRGPWFKKTDNFDALVVAEKADSRTPRAFASSRLRPSTEEESRAAAPSPKEPSRTISDDSDEYAIGDDLPSERQELLRRQIQAVQKLRDENRDTDLLENKEPQPGKESSVNFSMSDDSESSSFENKSTPVSKPSEPSPSPKPKNSDPSVPRQPVDAKLVSQPSSKDGQRKSAKQSDNSDVLPKQDLLTPRAESNQPPVVAVNATEDHSTFPETKIKIETNKSDYRALASETLAALQAELDNATALSPEQKLSLEGKKRMLSLVLDDLDGAMTPIEMLQAHEQAFFQHEFQALHTATDPKGNPVMNKRWTLTLQSHRKAQMNLAVGSNLEIQNATFCTEVDSFGILSKFPQYHFRKDQELLLYCELDNFVSTPVKDGFETQLQGSYEIVDSNGRRVADQLLPMDEHICRNQRRDYFIAYRMYMPKISSQGVTP